MSAVRLGLIGDPVAHSISPAMQNAALAALRIDARYAAWPTPAATLGERVATLRAAGMLGANVTLPHKLAVLPLLDALDPLAAAIGAVNTIVHEGDGRLRGYNTDAPAVLDTLRGEAGFEVRGRQVLLLGASGAARAACAMFMVGGATQITLLNRTLERAEALLADLIEALTNPEAPAAARIEEPPLLLAIAPGDEELAELAGSADLVVNATSLGWHGDALPIDPALLAPDALVWDMVYQSTPLLRACEKRGNRTLDGLGMLVRQGAQAFTLWTGREAPLEVMWAAARQALGSR